MLEATSSVSSSAPAQLSSLSSRTARLFNRRFTSLLFFSALIGGLAQPLSAQGFDWQTLAGSTRGPGSQDGTLAETRISGLSGVVADAAGNLYFTDAANHTIRKLSAAGISSTIAGMPGQVGSDDGTGEAARFMGPAGIAINSEGVLFVADTANQLIRRISVTGEVTTLAGQPSISGTSDGPGAEAKFNYPQGIAVGPGDVVYIADTYNHAIRKISADGVVSTFAGKSGEMGAADGAAGNARFLSPIGLLFTNDGFLQVADTGNCTLRRISPQGVVVTTSGQAGVFSFADGVGTAALFSDPTGITLDADGNLIVTEPSNSLLRRVTPDGVVTTLTGTLGAVGLVNGPPGIARFSYPQGVAFNPVTGLIAVADVGNEALRNVTAAGLTTTLVGGPRQPGATEGVGTAARFRSPVAITALPDGSFAVADSGNRTIRKLTAAGQTSLLAGLTGVGGAIDGNLTVATFGMPRGITADSSGTLYVGDTGNQLIRKITTNGQVSTIAGLPGGRSDVNRFLEAAGVVVDRDGNVYCTDSNQIRCISTGGGALHVAGPIRKLLFVPPDNYTLYSKGTYNPPMGDGAGADAAIQRARGPALDAAGNVYFADAGYHTIRKCTPAGVVTTLAGLAETKGSADGTGATARFFNPSGVAVAPDGTVYVADEGNHVIRKISPAGIVTTIGGRAGFSGTGNGIGSRAAFSLPGGLMLDPATGAVLVADTTNHRIVRGVAIHAPQLVVEAAGGRHLVDDTATEDFGAIAPGTRSAERTLVLHNVGNQPLELQSAVLEFGELSGFQIEGLSEPGAVAPNASLTLHVSFAPPSLGHQLARLVIRSNDPTHPAFALDLSGLGNSTPTFAGYSASTVAGQAISLDPLKLLAKATDADAGDLLTITGVDAVSSRGAAVRLVNGAVVYTPSPTLSGADTFFITIRDPRGSEVKGKVSLNIVASSIANNTLQTNPPIITHSTDGQVSLTFRGIPGRSYLIQRSIDLRNWPTVATVIASDTGTIEWQDPTPPGPTSYYRLANR